MECNNKDLEFNTPWIMQRADPYIYRHSDGKYYFTASVPEYDRIIIRTADSLWDLKSAAEREVWHKHDEGPMSYNVWAPELHYIDGVWSIYFASGEKEDIWKIRPYVLRCQGPDPMKDDWIEVGPMRPSDKDEFSFTGFSLDGTVFENKGKYYFIWAEKVGTGKQISNLYIAEMEDIDKLKTVQVLLSTPDYEWERRGFWVNEGPSVIKKNGQLFVTYSASDTGPAYCMGLLSISEEDNLLDPANWKKESKPILCSDEKLKIFGPGHNSFTVDDKGNDIMAYHARTESEIIGDPLYNPNRHAMLMRIRWSEDGRPLFGYE